MTMENLVRETTREGKHVIAVTGLSGSGKTTVCDYLSLYYGIPCFHPIAPLKRFLENQYGLQRGALDTDAGKRYRPPGAERTMQEQMVGLFHFYREFDPNYAPRILKRSFEEHPWKYSNVVSVTSLRSPQEAVVARNAAYDVQLHHIDIQRSDSPRWGTSSDIDYHTINYLLRKSPGTQTIIHNDGSKTELFVKVMQHLMNIKVLRLSHIDSAKTPSFSL